MRLGKRQKWWFLWLRVKAVFEISASARIKKKKMVGLKTGKEEIKLSLFTEDVIVHAENPMKSTKKLWVYEFLSWEL